MSEPLGLRRELGTLEAYAVLVGILIGAGIFKVTSHAWSLTGPSVILGHAVLAPVVLATSVPYAAYVSTSLGREPGGEYTHLARTLGGYGVAFVGAWLKVISYVGALAYLALAFAEYLVELSAGYLRLDLHRMPVAISSLVAVWAVHVAGVRWFGRLQVAMCGLLAVSLLVLIVPGLPAVHAANYRPFFGGGASGFARSLPPLFFAYAGFEALAQTAGEVKDSTRRLPAVFLRGIAATTLVYVLMSAVAFGALPGGRLAASATPMAEAASLYLPWGAAWFVTLGAVMALLTSLNSTMLVPSRLGLMLARDGLAPAGLGAVWERTGTPAFGLSLTLAGALLLLLSGQVSLALNIAVFALLLLYLLHSLAFLRLPALNPALDREVRLGFPRWAQRAAAGVSALAMGGLVAVQVASDLGELSRTTFAERVAGRSSTTLELCLLWALLGVVVYALGGRRRRAPSR
ncbi:MAG TPA: APC family permease [Vicinamibacteria bacterium]|nr:APC family permease [Vicinamibacteria bacterium]